MSGTTQSGSVQHLPGSAVRVTISQHNQLVSDLETVRRAAASAAYSAAGCAQATTTTQVKTTATVTYTSKGLFKTKAATDNLWTLAGTTVTAGNACYFVLGLNAAGTASAYQSSIASTLAACVAPTIPDGVAGIGQVTVVTTSTNFVPGTTAVATASGTTVAILDGWDPAAVDLLAAQVSDAINGAVL